MASVMCRDSSSSLASTSVSLDDDGEAHHCAKETAWQVRNTFLDVAGTEGALLADGERAQLLRYRGTRRAATCCAALSAGFAGAGFAGALPGDEEEDEEDKDEEDVSTSQSDDACASGSSGPHDVAECQPQVRKSTTCPVPSLGSSRAPRSTLPLPSSYVSISEALEADEMMIPGAQPTSPSSRRSHAHGAEGADSAANCDNACIGLYRTTIELDQQEHLHGRVPVHRGDCGVFFLPSMGSAGHHLRECMPCAFLDSRKGCVRAFECTYCHLCGLGEKKRRHKEKRKMFSSLRHVQQPGGSGGA
mmetsp:Transcript_58620/g.168317  ORF Transcript_58620/g.168317 Transcript_58620/m.168317 type:complete len:304 (-) Transcript_58620:255-1166(-)|eukprot:CAMPEP_0177184508 /NCGR_PEP_ID=MMETSP0367-20130122/17596_1 /TAXON_ID=447022 ORGANISM="Scrippsiella hangoei-like, Strain SHHI-4" /NCGR_SAMPLE_ID=MMETSP0367 /ASSEMBLY_ACC=CAM_ASM_000362 /LENGTH=303 /DNA_ID=CAMNT_0018631631 /DNA_START=69 /DNA_END=980 /DNA_ORIENTATION=-